MYVHMQECARVCVPSCMHTSLFKHRIIFNTPHIAAHYQSQQACVRPRYGHAQSTGMATGNRLLKLKFYCATHILSTSSCRLNEKLKRNLFSLYGSPTDLLTREWRRGRQPSHVWDDMIKSHRPWKATEAVAHGLFRQSCVPLSSTSIWWEILRILCACVRKEKKENGWEGECASDRRRGCLWVCETEDGVHEVTSRQLFDFPSFPGRQMKNNVEEGKKPASADNWNAPKTSLFVGDWIIAFAWDCRQGKYVSDCDVLVADTYHRPDSSTHPSPSAPHNSRNTLKRSSSEGKGMQDKYWVSISLPFHCNCLPHWQMNNEVFWTLLRAIFYF